MHRSDPASGPLAQPLSVGIVGCGDVSKTYLRTLGRFDHVRVVACADLDLEKAKRQAERFGIPRACAPEELYADPEISLVVNLTVPVAHAPVALAALRAGKSVYNEKPLATDQAAADQILELAAGRGLRVGAAPDTFLGDSLQAARVALDEGRIGSAVGAVALSVRKGPEDWHPNPAFFYQPGAGPLFDLGPYYLTTLVSLLGPVRRVIAVARASFPERLIRAGPLAGTRIAVTTPTNVAGILQFESGAIGLLLMTFDVIASKVPYLEVYGSEGTLSLPDPTEYGGAVRIWNRGDESWSDVYRRRKHGRDRGIGAAEMAEAMLAARPHRANGEMGRHVVDIMSSLYEASDSGGAVELTTSCERPAPVDAQTVSRETAA
jgi:predicted dehydrogenase